MKAVLTFDLKDEEDNYEYRITHQASGMRSAVYEFAQRLRAQKKHGDDPMASICEELYAELHDLLSENGVNLYEDL